MKLAWIRMLMKIFFNSAPIQKKIPKLISISINRNSSPFYSRKNPLFKSSVAAFTILKRIIIFKAISKLQVFSFKSSFKHESSENLIKNLIEKIMGTSAIPFYNEFWKLSSDSKLNRLTVKLCYSFSVFSLNINFPVNIDFLTLLAFHFDGNGILMWI